MHFSCLRCTLASLPVSRQKRDRRGKACRWSTTATRSSAHERDIPSRRPYDTRLRSRSRMNGLEAIL
eukprot:8718786-Pyramimonas_sp.AAC.1